MWKIAASRRRCRTLGFMESRDTSESPINGEEIGFLLSSLWFALWQRFPHPILREFELVLLWLLRCATNSGLNLVLLYRLNILGAKLCRLWEWMCRIWCALVLFCRFGLLAAQCNVLGEPTYLIRWRKRRIGFCWTAWVWRLLIPRI